MHYNPLTIVFRSFLQKLKQELKINDLYYRVKLGLVVTRKDYVQLPHLDCEAKKENHSWMCHVPICISGIYLYVWDDLGNTKQLLKITLCGFLVLCDDLMHGGMCGGPGNVRVFYL